MQSTNRLYLILAPTLIFLSVAACAPFPELAAQPVDTGPYPTLLPIDELLAQADAP